MIFWNKGGENSSVTVTLSIPSTKKYFQTFLYCSDQVFRNIIYSQLKQNFWEPVEPTEKEFLSVLKTISEIDLLNF